MIHSIGWFVLSALLLSFASCGSRGMGGEGASIPRLRKDYRIEYYLNKEASDLTEITIRETFERWGEATHFEFVYKGRHRAGIHRDGKNTVSFLIKWPPEVPIKHVAYCQNWYDNEGNIIESDIIFNMAIARFTTHRTNTPSSYYIEGLLTHEIGHMIGLSHVLESKTQDSDSLNTGNSDGSSVSSRSGVQSCVMKQLLTIEDSASFLGPDSRTIQAYQELYRP